MNYVLFKRNLIANLLKIFSFVVLLFFITQGFSEPMSLVCETPKAPHLKDIKSINLNVQNECEIAKLNGRIPPVSCMSVTAIEKAITECENKEVNYYEKLIYYFDLDYLVIGNEINVDHESYSCLFGESGKEDMSQTFMKMTLKDFIFTTRISEEESILIVSRNTLEGKSGSSYETITKWQCNFIK